MKVFVRAIVLSLACLAQYARAGETWVCTFVPSFSKVPMLVSYRVERDRITQIWPSGEESQFQLLQNNKYGLIGVSSISEIEANQRSPTVGAMTVLIGKQTKEFWLTSVIVGQPVAANEPVHGTCINK